MSEVIVHFFSLIRSSQYPGFLCRGDGDDEYFGFKDLVNDAVGKSSRLTPAAVFGIGMPRLWKLFNPCKRVERFQQKLISKTKRLCVVILYRLVKLLLSDVEKANLHLLAVF